MSSALGGRAAEARGEKGGGAEGRGGSKLAGGAATGSTAGAAGGVKKCTCSGCERGRQRKKRRRHFSRET
jgi:hypothetical protein